MANKNYTVTGENYKAAKEKLREQAAAEGVTIKAAEILYQCLLHYELPQPSGSLKEYHSEPEKIYRKAFEDVLKEAGLSEKQFRAKRKTGECRLEVIAAGPHRNEKAESLEAKAEDGKKVKPELKPSGAAPQANYGNKLTDLF